MNAPPQIRTSHEPHKWTYMNSSRTWESHHAPPNIHPSPTHTKNSHELHLWMIHELRVWMKESHMIERVAMLRRISIHHLHRWEWVTNSTNKRTGTRHKFERVAMLHQTFINHQHTRKYVTNSIYILIHELHIRMSHALHTWMNRKLHVWMSHELHSHELHSRYTPPSTHPPSTQHIKIRHEPHVFTSRELENYHALINTHPPTLRTGWRRPIGCLILMGYFLQTSLRISGSFAKKDLQIQASMGLRHPVDTYACVVSRNTSVSQCGYTQKTSLWVQKSPIISAKEPYIEEPYN